ncbi:hypothetical protein [Tatumella saanichensis]|uniref:hypothetical protein n=1 Tax=Tatumella saanichensis TaxID=480813 RepID=UPI0004A4F72C|nr:hypothetical protein [Tatumella saanichensis]
MPYQQELIRYLQNNDILALKLEKALKGVGEMVWDKVQNTGSGIKRLSNYVSCFTTNYQDVCQQQGEEDARFGKAVLHLLKNSDILEQMLIIYIKELIKNKSPRQLEKIKKGLMAVNVYIAATTLTKAAFAFGIANAIVLGTKLSVDISILTAGRITTAIFIVGYYSIVQKAVDSALRLQIASPFYYNALYTLELEMLYFIIEPLFSRADVFSIISPTEQDIINIIAKMAR